MAIKKVTMQDIADACGLSRNTVSKIFNDRGAVPEATRRLVLQRAQELGYRQLPKEAPAAAPEQGGSIAVLSGIVMSDYHFGNTFIPAFAARLSRKGHTMTMYNISREMIRRGELPPQVAPGQVSGILGIEIFDKKYMEAVCALGLPTLFIDAYADIWRDLMMCDMISMENTAGVIQVVRHMIDSGAKRLSFVGDIHHCSSFHQRWIGFTLALADAGIPLDRSMCIMEDDDNPYDDPSWLVARLRAMPALPDGIFCANDYLAVNLMAALKQMGLSIPRDVMVAGFDGQPQAGVVEPGLTTVDIPCVEIGTIAADMLLRRIEARDLPPYAVHVRTTPIFRGSTERRAFSR